MVGMAVRRVARLHAAVRDTRRDWLHKASTAIVREIGDEAWRQRQTVHHLRMRDHLNVFRGREIKTMGDGFLASFDGPARAIECTREMRATLAALADFVKS